MADEFGPEDRAERMRDAIKKLEEALGLCRAYLARIEESDLYGRPRQSALSRKMDAAGLSVVSANEGTFRPRPQEPARD